MNRERAKELLPIIEAFAEGKEIEMQGNSIGWEDGGEQLSFDTELEYRIKPQPREFWVCGSYDGQNPYVAYENTSKDCVDHHHEYILVREVL